MSSAPTEDYKAVGFIASEDSKGKQSLLKAVGLTL